MASVEPSSPPEGRRGLKSLFSGSKFARVFSNYDFRLMWIGAFLSFTGSWVQKIAEGYFVYQMTQDETKLSFIAFCNSFPVFIFGFVLGYLSDTMNKRRVLVVTTALYAVGAMYLAIATYYKFIEYWHIVAVALITGLISCIEMPTRQSIVSRVVPPEDLAAAVPINAMTFNVARIVGPAIGGYILAKQGVAACYLLNGISFIALIWAAKAIRSNLAVAPRDPQPMKDLIFEGAIYTWRETRLRTLLILETITALFGIFYIQLVPAYVDQALGLHIGSDAAKTAIAWAYTSIGIGAMIGLVVNIALSDTPHKRTIIQASMTIIAIGLLVMAFERVEWIAYTAMAFVGGATIMQFNSTNALFQILSPERLRGRVLAMHIWALNGLSPFGVLFFGWLATTSRNAAGGIVTAMPSSGVRLSLLVGGLCVAVGAVASYLSHRNLANLHEAPER